MPSQQSQSIHPMSGANGGADLQQIKVDETLGDDDEKPPHIEGEDWRMPTTESLR